MTSSYQVFTVKILNPDASHTPVAGATVKVYNYTGLSDAVISPLTANASGVIAGGSLPVAAGTVIRFRCENDGHGRAGFAVQTTDSGIGQDLILKPSPGGNIVLSPGARAAIYKSATVMPAFVEVFWITDGEPIEAAQSLGLFPMGVPVKLKFNPPADRDVWLISIPYNTFATAGYRSLMDAPRQKFNFSRSPGQPTITQFSNATTTGVTLKVSGFNQYTVGRRITFANNVGFSSPSIFYVDLTQVADQTYQFFGITAASSAQDRWIKIAHSSNGHDANSAWGTDSTSLQVTFPGTVSGGGSPGGGDPTPPDKEPFLEIT